jgi:hypothetical protein
LQARKILPYGYIWLTKYILPKYAWEQSDSKYQFGTVYLFILQRAVFGHWLIK